jgi:hypothetical protein
VKSLDVEETPGMPEPSLPFMKEATTYLDLSTTYFISSRWLIATKIQTVKEPLTNPQRALS